MNQQNSLRIGRSRFCLASKFRRGHSCRCVRVSGRDCLRMVSTLQKSSFSRITLTLMALTIIAVTMPAAHAQTFSVLYDFGTKGTDPRNPSFSGIVAQGRDGNLYSTAPVGGSTGNGAMFMITPGGTLTVPYSFDATGAQPYSGLTLGTDGNFYGTTY